MALASMFSFLVTFTSVGVVFGLPTEEECRGPFPIEYSQCSARMNWMLNNWQKYPSYARKGVDGSRCSIQHYLNTEEGGPKGYCPPIRKDSAFEDNVYEYDSGVGEYGATCQCPDGSTYAVGDLNDGCSTFACYGGEIIDSCLKSRSREGARMKVSCGQSNESSQNNNNEKENDVDNDAIVPVEPPNQANNVYEYDSGVGEYGATCQCPDGSTYAVGDLNDGCSTFACYGGEIIDSCVKSRSREGARMKAVCDGFQVRDITVDNVDDDVQINVVSLNVFGYRTMPGAADTYAQYILAKDAHIVGIQEGANDWELPNGQQYPSDYSRAIALLNSLNKFEPNCWQRQYQIFINTCKGLSAIESYRFDLTNGPQATRTGETMKVTMNGKSFAFVNIHWENTSGNVREFNSKETAAEVNALMGNQQVVITVGDFNEGCTSYHPQFFAQESNSELGAMGNIDCIFATQESSIQYVSGGASFAGPSDHPLVYASYRLL